MFLVSKPEQAEGKPRVEAYAAGKLVASADAVAVGLGALVGELVGLVGELSGPPAAGMSLMRSSSG